MATIKKRQKIASFGKDVERSEPLCVGGRNVKWYSRCGKWYGISSKNYNRVTIRFSNYSSGYTPKESESRVSN